MISMLNDFCIYRRQFDEYLTKTFNERKMKVIAHKSGTIDVHYGQLQDELFHLSNYKINCFAYQGRVLMQIMNIQLTLPR